MSRISNSFTTRRSFIKGVSAAAFGMYVAPGIKPAFARNSPKKGQEWINNTYRELLVANHMPEEWEHVWSRFDAEAAAQMFQDAGVQKVCYVAKCMYAFSYYPTKIGVVHPHLERDEVGEFTKALKKRGIRCVPYFYPGIDTVQYKLHPDWRYTEEKAIGNPGKNITMCFNSPYTDEIAIPQMKELLSLYDVDGLFLDIVVHPYMIWNCHCKYCRELYAREVGGEIPKDKNDSKAFVYRKWLNGKMDALMDKFYRELAAVKPGILLEYNMAWNYRYPVNPPDYVPFITLDSATPDVGLFSWNISMEARYLSTLPGVVWSVMNTRMCSWGDFSLREADALMQECALNLAACGKTYLADLPYPSGRFEPAVYETLGKVNERTKALEPFVKGCRPVKDTAVLHTADTIWSKEPISPFPEWRGGPAYYPINGAHKALIEGHVQMGILNSEVFNDTIGDYNALILPDQRILTPKELETIKRFVNDGGALIASFETGTRDTDNNVLSDFALSDVFGIRYIESMETANCYLRGTPELKLSDIPVMDIQINGAYTRIAATTAKPLLELVPPYQGIDTGTPPPAEFADGPGVTVNRYGKGGAVYFAPEIFGGYFRADTPVMRKLILWALNLIYPVDTRQIYLEGAPINVELFYNRRKNERFIHLVNYSGDKRDIGTPQVQDIPAVHGIKVNVRLENKPSSVRIVPNGKDIAFEYTNGVLQFNAEPLRIHDVYQVVI